MNDAILTCEVKCVKCINGRARSPTENVPVMANIYIYIYIRIIHIQNDIHDAYEHPIPIQGDMLNT